MVDQGLGGDDISRLAERRQIKTRDKTTDQDLGGDERQEIHSRLLKGTDED